jgi:hypothetical protein
MRTTSSVHLTLLNCIAVIILIDEYISWTFSLYFLFSPFFPIGIYSAFVKSLCTYERCLKSIERSIVSKTWIKQLHTLPVLHFNRCLTTEYSEKTAHCNGNFGTDNQIYVGTVAWVHSDFPNALYFPQGVTFKKPHMLCLSACDSRLYTTYLFTYFLHGAESFLRS